MEPQPELVHVLDLPQLYTRPPASSLLSALSLLVAKPRSWSPTNPAKQQSLETSPRVHPDGVTDYLTKIVASSLAWIREDDVKETIWESASLRLAERSGRSAMPAMERTFSIPSGPAREDVDLIIHEPALTADKLGLKTWAASYLLAKRLYGLDLPSLRKSKSWNRQYQILELGSGTGLVGIAAAAVLDTGVVVTDLPEIEANLARNVDANRTVITRHGGFVTTATLDWSSPNALCPTAAVQALDTRKGSSIAAHDGAYPALKTEAPLPTPPDSALPTPAVLPGSFSIIVAADCIYDPAHPAMLVSTIKNWLSKSDESRVVIELPLRDAYASDIEALQDGLRNIGLTLIDQGHESGIDDWGGDDDVREVSCWWGAWRWTQS